MLTGMENALKEVDMQIVYRRLEARKRNITDGGRLSRRHMAMAYRGYHGLESQYHALQHLSQDTMTATKVRNDNIQNRHAEEMKTLIQHEKITKERTERVFQALREDFTAQLAYQYVSKNQSFKRNYKSQKQDRKPRPVSDNPQLYAEEIEKRKSARAVGPRTLGSLRQIESYKDELKLNLPPIKDSQHGSDGLSPRVNMMGGKSYQELQHETEEHENKHDHKKKFTTFPNIENALGVEIKYRLRQDDDKESMISAPAANLDAESNYTGNSSPLPHEAVHLDMAQNLLQLKRAEEARYERQRRNLPPTPLGGRKHILPPRDDKSEKREAWRRILPDTPSRSSTIFPGTAKNSIGLKKLLDAEISFVRDHWSHSNHRQEVVELAKERNRLKLAEHPLPTFDQKRSTSAILREYKEYKRQEEERRVALTHILEGEQREGEPVIVRQISPQPRPASPMAARRTDFINRLKTPSTRLRPPSDTKSRPSSELAPTAGKLKRTDSEKFPSVSRTSSYKELPEEELTELHKNAMLTTAERLDIEKKKQEAGEVHGNKKEMRGKGQRKLPRTPNQKADTDHQIDVVVKYQANTCVAHIDKDSDMINRVKLANLGEEDGYVKRKGTPLSKVTAETDINAEHNSYTPLIKYREGSAISNVPFPEESIHRMKVASALHDKDLWPKLAKKMHFNYDNFTRSATADTAKRRLELKAKQRRKIKQKNAQLEEERRRKLKEAEDASERPPTRVSFNENVIVFQTI
ncbi:uncharacterized protein LOC128218356 [Mya arenaria]|nr:uncharacterized protein LOC128218356 [Mya arenaria]